MTWHYQWMVLNDFLPQFLDTDALDDIRTNGRQFYTFTGRPFMPVEFSVAGYRLGHSMVREVYNHNRVFAPITFNLLFQFTGGGGLGSQATLPSNWIIDWRRFHQVDGTGLLNVTRRLDTKLVPALHTLPGINPGQPVSLAVRNLLRGSRVGLPAGQDVAQAIGATVLSSGEMADGDEGEILRRHGLDQATPLWYYILKEAELQGEGKRLGEVGSRIIGEVFVGLIEEDPNSFLSSQPDWEPTLPSATSGDFTMVDLLKFVDDINPIERFFAPTEPPSTGRMHVYTVQAGDILTSIARAFGTTVDEIVQINGIENPDLIFEGQVLCVPLGSDGLPVTEDHIVEPGDTLDEIAERFGTTVEEITQLNHISNPDLIFVGQRLLIPRS